MRARHRLPLLAVVAAGALRLGALLAATPLVTPDTFDYVRQSRLPLFSAAFWGSQHPPLLPLLWKPLPGLAASVDPVRVGDLSPALVLDGAIAAGCWGALALTLSSLARGAVVRWAVLLAVLALSLAPEVTGWESAGLSESLSLSVTALALALAIRYARTPSLRAAAALGAVVLAAALTRDTLLPLLVLALLPVAALVRRHVRVLAVFVVVAAALSLWGQAAGRRSEIPTRNAIGVAMLQSPADTAWFRAHGLPWRPDTLTLFFERPNARFTADPRTAALRGWLDESGRRTWLEFLATHPSRTIELGGRLGDVYDPPTSVLRPYWGGDANGWYPHGALFLVLCALGLAAAWSRRRARDGVVLLAFLAATLPTAVLIWDADRLEFARHAVALPVLARVSLVALVLLAAEPLYERARNAAVSIPKYVGAS